MYIPALNPRALRRLLPWVAAMAVLIPLASCSTTSRLPKGEILYTGVKKIDIQYPRVDSLPKAPGLAGDVKDAVNVAPNNSLVSPYLRYPFPLGLWVWNHWDDPGHGFKHWLYNKLVAEPVLVSDVRPEVRTEMIDQILDNNGYFRGRASYELVQGKNKRKASIRYKVVTGNPYIIDSVQLLPDTCRLYHIIDSVARRSEYFQKGSRYSTDSLAALRIDIANAVRNRGYYFFKPDYIEYLADSTITPERIAMRLSVASNTPRPALEKWVTGRVRTTVYRNEGDGVPDTTSTRRGELVVMRPARLREGLIPGCITFRKGKTFSVRDMNRTQTYLSRLGIFNGIDIAVIPDTSAAVPTLDVDIQCTFDKPLEASLEINATSKSNSYLGPGLIFNLTNRNIFGGGEQLTVSLKGSYEWQTGRERGRSVFNSYEVGLGATLSFPRLIAPRFVERSRRELNWTRINLSADLLNRPHYFRMAQFNTSFAYDWRVNRHVVNTFTPLKLTYTKLIHTTADFDSIMTANPAIAQSFMTQFIPQMLYNITYDKAIDRNNRINVQVQLQEAGNVLWAAYRAFGNRGEKRLFGTPFSQFLKAQAQVVFGCRVIGASWLYSRVACGVAHAYGNSSQVPYSEQFYVGGANSVRAFTVRSLGPGSYRPGDNVVNGYFDQTGTFKFEANVEYRFPIYGPLHGALFLDSGNVWLLKNDPQRPGGKLEGKSFFRDLALGTGAGLRVDIGMLVIRGDLGIGIHAPYKTKREGYYNMTSFAHSLAFHLAIGYPF